MVMITTAERLRIPDLLKSWPWLSYLNPAFHQRLGDEELEYFYKLPEVCRKKPLQIMIQKAFVREFGPANYSFRRCLTLHVVSMELIRTHWLFLALLPPPLALFMTMILPHINEGLYSFSFCLLWLDSITFQDAFH